MTRHILLLCWLLLLPCAVPALAQSADRAQSLFLEGQYEEAGELYLALLRKSPRSALYNYRYARCCYELGDWQTARDHFEAAGERYPLRNFYLGELYFHAYEFDKALEAYGKYIPSLSKDDERIPLLQKKMEQSERAGRFLARVEDIAIVDSMVVDKAGFLNHYQISSESGSLEHDKLFLTADSALCRVSHTTQRQDRTYFSDTVGGQMRLFTAYRLLDEWSPPTPLPPSVNTGDNVNFPFLMSDGVTLYFASEGEHTLGGYDIFVTKYVPSTDRYLTPENVGMPFNSPYNDYMLLIDEARGIGWFATDRYQPDDKVVIYRFVPNETTRVLSEADADYVRRAARLQAYRKAELPGTTLTSSDKQQPEAGKPKEKIEFFVTDQLIYTHPSQFKSPEARTAWTELDELLTRREEAREELAALRGKYELLDDEKERLTVASKILELEKLLQEQESLIDELTVRVRNAEINAL